jgi:serralysin
MIRAKSIQLSAEELEPRHAPATLTFEASASNGPDVITVRLDDVGKKILVLDDGVPVASRNVQTTDAVVILGSAGEGDSLVVDFGAGNITVPVIFNGGAAGAMGEVTSGTEVTLDFSESAVAITADIGLNATTVVFAGGGGVSVLNGTVSKVVGTDGDDTFIDNTSIDLLALEGRLGDDSYFLNPGSTIAIVDDGGDDTLDFSSNPEAVGAVIETMETTVTDADGEVIFVGTVEEVVGSSFDDTFVDMGEADYTFVGGEGDDLYDLQPGSTITVVEKAGNDLIRLSRARFGVNANLAAGEITDTNGNKVKIINDLIENLDGSPFADSIVGNAANNVLFGGGGDDALDGGDGNDTYILILSGNDIVTDSSGFDVLDFSRTTGTGVTVDLGQTTGVVQNIAPGATLAINGVIETLIGTQQNDVLSGSGGADILVGLGGNDRLQGQAGNDVLLGGKGDDDLNGGSGLDILVGGLGTDRLNSGSGEDILIAGYTSYDTVLLAPGMEGLTDQIDLTAWSAIQAIWVGSGSVRERITAINSGDEFRLRASDPGQTVFDDGAPDVLTGSQSTDWFFVNLDGGDKITDKDNREFVNDL